MSIGLHIKLEQIESRVILRIAGRIDASSSPILERKITSLIDEHHYELLFDFSEVDYLSSAGMRVLLAATKKLGSKKGLIVLFSVSDDVEEIIKMAGFDRILPICKDETEAMQFHK